MPVTKISPKKTRVKILFLRFLKLFLFSDSWASVKNGTKVVLKVPSAKSLRNKFGIL